MNTSILTSPAPEGYATHVEYAQAAAHAWRQRLGIADQAPVPADAWKLRKALGSAIRVRKVAGFPGLILHRSDMPDLIILPDTEVTPAHQAAVLVHEIGHHLLTNFAEAATLANFRAEQALSPGELRAEAEANAFMLTFLGACVPDAVRERVVQ